MAPTIKPYNTDIILKSHHYTSGEKKLLEKKVGFYTFTLEPFVSIVHYSPEIISKEVERSGGILNFEIQTNNGLFYAKQYKKLRAEISKFFNECGFTKLAQNVLSFEGIELIPIKGTKEELLPAKYNAPLAKLKRTILSKLDDIKIKDELAKIIAKHL